MEVTINIPEELGKQLTNQWGNSPQKVLEALAVEGYRQRVLTSAQVQELLNLESRWETEKLLSDYQAYLDYTEEDFQEDIETLNDLLDE
jgi:predicted HTH domain antitoxin